MNKHIYNSVGRNVPFKRKLVSFFEEHPRRYHLINNSLNKPTFYGTATVFEPYLLAKLIKGFWEENPKKAYDLKNAMDLDISDRIPNDILTRSDRSTSGASIELRVPFLAHQLVDYSAGISHKLLMKNKTPKYLIKKLATKYLNHELVYRKKVGFDLPIKHWISNELKEVIDDTINHSVQTEFIDIDTIKQCFNLHLNKNIDYSSKLWAFLCLELSYRYLSRSPS